MDWEEIKEARRRLAQERGAVVKDWGGKVPFALIYPNSYFVGMSNLGIHTIYRLLNNYDNVLCERAFWESGKSPLSIESQRPLSDFAVLAFSLSYELDYFNVVQLLKANGIPLLAAERDETYPLIIAGGPCVFTNPAPVAPFFDCLCIGEAETILPVMVPVLAEGIGEKRENLLLQLSEVPGLYVPQYFTGTAVKRQWIANLADFPVFSTIITPDTELGDLFLLEVERGCGWGCRFCLVNSAFSPLRFQSLDNLISHAREGLKYRKRLGLMGPAVTTHPYFEELLDTLLGMGAELSLSSLRIRPLSSRVLQALASGRAQSITLAPEAGSERLRQLINKCISEDDILRAVDEATKAGINQIKFYFIVGLPAETDEDATDIVKLVEKCQSILDKHRSGGRITVNLSPFVPKASTPWQLQPMAPISILNRRLALVKNGLQRRGVKVKTESPAWSEVQAILSRGDSRVAGTVAVTEDASLSAWRKAVSGQHLDVDFYAHTEWNGDQKLAWDVIESRR